MPWECKSCSSQVSLDVLKCPTCGKSKTAWSLVTDKTRTLVLAKRNRLEVRRGRLIVSTPQSPHEHVGVAWLRTDEVSALKKSTAHSLLASQRLPDPFDLLCVRMFPTAKQKRWKLTVGVNSEKKKVEEREFDFERDRERLGEDGCFSTFFLCVHGPEALPEFRLPFLHVLDVSDDTTMGFAPTIEIGVARGKPIEVRLVDTEGKARTECRRGADIPTELDALLVHTGAAWPETEQVSSLPKADALGLQLGRLRPPHRDQFAVHLFPSEDAATWQFTLAIEFSSRPREELSFAFEPDSERLDAEGRLAVLFSCVHGPEDASGLRFPFLHVLDVTDGSGPAPQITVTGPEGEPIVLEIETADAPTLPTQPPPKQPPPPPPVTPPQQPPPPVAKGTARRRLSLWINRIDDLIDLKLWSQEFRFKQGGEPDRARVAARFAKMKGLVDDVSLIRTIQPIGPELQRARLQIDATQTVDPPGVKFDSLFASGGQELAAKLSRNLIEFAHANDVQIFAGYAIGDIGSAKGALGQAFIRFMEKASDQQIKDHAVAVDRFLFEEDGLGSFDFDGIGFDIELNGSSHIARPMEVFYHELARLLLPRGKCVTYASGIGLTAGGQVAEDKSPNFARAQPIRIAGTGGPNLICRPMAYDAGIDDPNLRTWHEGIIDFSLNQAGLAASQLQLGVKVVPNDLAPHKDKLDEIEKNQGLAARKAEEAKLRTASTLTQAQVVDRCQSLCAPKDVGLITFVLKQSDLDGALAIYNQALNTGRVPAGSTVGHPLQAPLTPGQLAAFKNAPR